MVKRKIDGNQAAPDAAGEKQSALKDMLAILEPVTENGRVLLTAEILGQVNERLRQAGGELIIENGRVDIATTGTNARGATHLKDLVNSAGTMALDAAPFEKVAQQLEARGAVRTFSFEGQGQLQGFLAQAAREGLAPIFIGKSGVPVVGFTSAEGVAAEDISAAFEQASMMAERAGGQLNFREGDVAQVDALLEGAEQYAAAYEQLVEATVQGRTNIANLAIDAMMMPVKCLATSVGFDGAVDVVKNALKGGASFIINAHTREQGFVETASQVATKAKDAMMGLVKDVQAFKPIEPSMARA